MRFNHYRMIEGDPIVNTKTEFDRIEVFQCYSMHTFLLVVNGE